MSKAVTNIFTDYPPCCIEFCPAYPKYFLAGTYELSPTKNRKGSIIIYRLEEEKITCLHTFSQPDAILDLHFRAADDTKDVFAVASSSATLNIFRFCPLNGLDRLIEHIKVVRIPGVDETVLFLACAWHPSIRDTIAVSTSAGSVYVMRLGLSGNANDLGSNSRVRPIMLHGLEAWTVTFDPPLGRYEEMSLPGIEYNWARNENDDIAVTVYSGGDDSKLQYTSCSIPRNMPEGCNLLFPNSTSRTIKLSGHEAGVTAILPLPLILKDGGKVLLTGSYDDYIRVYSIQDPLDNCGLSKSRCLAAENLGGGVWRLKEISLENNGERGWSLKALVSCIYAGARVVNINLDFDGTCQISVLARFEEKDIMNYGSDIQPGSSYCVSTSFYQKLLFLWKFRNV